MGRSIHYGLISWVEYCVLYDCKEKKQIKLIQHEQLLEPCDEPIY